MAGNERALRLGLRMTGELEGPKEEPWIRHGLGSRVFLG